MNYSRFNRPTSAFTLIELLTVIAILGILAAILIPVVGAVRENARKAKCMSNMRQVGLAILAYESEIGKLPGPSYQRIRRPVADQEHRYELNWILESYMGGERSEVLECPTNVIDFGPDVNPANIAFITNNRPTVTNPPRFFGYPGSGLGPKSLEQIISAGFGPVSASLTELTQIWMLSDVDGQNYYSVTEYPFPSDILPVHDGGRNYVFFDGHAEFRGAGDFPP